MSRLMSKLSDYWVIGRHSPFDLIPSKYKRKFPKGVQWSGLPKISMPKDHFYDLRNQIISLRFIINIAKVLLLLQVENLSERKHFLSESKRRVSSNWSISERFVRKMFAKYSFSKWVVIRIFTPKLPSSIQSKDKQNFARVFKEFQKISA